MFKKTSRGGWVAALVLAALTPVLISCGGSSDSSDSSEPPPSAPTQVQVPYQAGDLAANDARLTAVTGSLGATAGALVQSIYAINRFVYTDNQSTDFAEYQQRHADAVRALDVLLVNATKTDALADALPGEKEALKMQQAAVSPREVEAILNSSKSKWPIKTLMEHYKVSAKRAQLILNNAMAGLTSEAYMEQAQVETQVITRLTLVKEASALTVAVGSAALTAGAAGGALTAWEATTALVQATDAIIKVSKASAELALGQDGVLDDTYQKSVLVRGIAAASELLSIKDLFKKPKTDLDSLGVAGYVVLKGNELLEDKTVSFGAESITVQELTAAAKEEILEHGRRMTTPGGLAGTYVDDSNKVVVVEKAPLPEILVEAISTLPVSEQLEVIQELLPEPDDDPAIDKEIVLSAQEVASDEGSITYRVSARVPNVRQAISVTLDASNASVTNAAQTLSADGTVQWSVVVHTRDAVVTVKRSDSPTSASIVLPGKTYVFDGTYSGSAVTTYWADNVFCFSSVPITVHVIGTTLSGSVSGSVNENRMSGKDNEFGMVFSGTISGVTMHGTWSDPEGGCAGTFSLTRQ